METNTPKPTPDVQARYDAIQKQCAHFGDMKPGRCLLLERNWPSYVKPERCAMCPDAALSSPPTGGLREASVRPRGWLSKAVHHLLPDWGSKQGDPVRGAVVRGVPDADHADPRLAAHQWTSLGGDIAVSLMVKPGVWIEQRFTPEQCVQIIAAILSKPALEPVAEPLLAALASAEAPRETSAWREARAKSPAIEALTPTNDEWARCETRQDAYNLMRHKVREAAALASAEGASLDRIDGMLAYMRAASPQMEELFTEGQCYRLAQALRCLRPDGVIVYAPREGHVYLRVEEQVIDINGVRAHPDLDSHDTLTSDVPDDYKPLAPAASAEAPRETSAWRPIADRPKDEMFIWAKPKADGKWSLGLGYNNVSGGWSDAYGHNIAAVTHCCDLPPTPATPQARG